MTAPVRSMVRNGTLKLGGTGPTYADATEFNVPIRSVKVTPSSTAPGDPVELLGGAKLAGERTRSYKLEGSSIQQFDNPAAFQAYCFAQDGNTVHFILKFNAAGSPTYAGDVVVTALPEGGDVGFDPGNVDFSFDGVGWYTRVDPS